MTGSRVGSIFAFSIDVGRLTTAVGPTQIDGGFAQGDNDLYWVSDTKIWRLPKAPAAGR
jgi:hypothetical protein